MKSYSVDCRNLVLNEEVSGTLQSKKTGGYSLNYVNPIMEEIVFQQNQREEVRLLEDNQAGALKKEQGTHNTNFIMQETYCIQGSVIGRGDKNGPNGSGIKEEEAFTLNTIDIPAVNYAEINQLSEEIICYGFDSLSSNSMKSKNPHSGVHVDEITKTLDCSSPCPSKNQGGNAIVHVTKRRVRRLTPTEFARLQGFPDEHCKIEGASDAKEYSVYGNSMTVNVMRWLGKRIKAVDDILLEL